MNVYYLRWPDRDEIYLPDKALIEINYGGVYEEETGYYFTDEKEKLGLREIIARKLGKIEGKVLDVEDYQIQLPLREGSFEVEEKLVQELLEAKEKPKRFVRIIEKLVSNNLEGIILTEEGLKRRALNLNIPYRIN